MPFPILPNTMTTELSIIGSRDILGKTVNAYGDFENPLFDPAEVAEWLDYRKDNISHMLADVDENEKVLIEVPTVDSSNGYESKKQVNLRTKRWFLKEFGLYETLMLSKKPQAKEFKKGVKALLHDLRTGKAKLAPQSLEQQVANGLIAANQIIQRLKTQVAVAEQQIEVDKPKVVFADAVSVSKSSILIAELAKILRQNGMDIGGTRLFERLRTEGYLCSKGSQWNMPSQRSMDLCLFEIKETVITHSDGHTTISKTPKVTGKGQIYFVNKYLGKDTIIAEIA